MSPSKALRRALSRTADLLWDLALVTQNVTIESLDQDGVVDSLGPQDLLLLMDGPDGTTGLAAIDREIMTGIIEVQTILQVTQIPIDPERVLTPTDAAMMAPLLDGTLELMSGYLVDHPLKAEIEGFKFGAMLEDARTASLLLDAHGYRAFRADMDLALGRRKGRLSIILPEVKKKAKKSGEEAGKAGPGPYEELLSRVPARLDAVLTRIKLPLGRAGELKPGDVLTLPPDALDKVEVIAGRNQLVAKGRMGQQNGLRAVRLTWPKRNGGAEMAAATAGAPADELPDIGGLPSLPDATPDFDKGGFDGGDAAGDLGDFGGDFGAPSEEALPDLPPLDFGSEAAEFDMGEFDLGDLDGGETTDDGLADIGLDEGFASAPVDFDFDEK
ncbi:Type III flagellar switch regulator (C-ring) FliN C-term [Tropicibacter naphthalenivorans]|uniref:Flagellar motor switch protein FliM n=2 Tax=Tropicibacter naphthalenivorans TaxID=441103 RepID=A0A0P1H3S1_9RHOB|nr:FliM/FliN family flagellar motor C-terminal domain-containing protein [Tropicibacter naphthalenivorans]CUH82647.1 flagellar motor switch protein FliM [Tropicibacter naphthalenivorans]SMD10132.1 Type III flagellar switch regulator (C-ring) FliN C-term [Tropicibacter naphthalenivorans]